MFQTYLRRDWDNEIETGVELRAENQFLATCQAASVSVKCLGMSLLRLSEISPLLSDILYPSSRCDDARPGTASYSHLYPRHFFILAP